MADRDPKIDPKPGDIFQKSRTRTAGTVREIVDSVEFSCKEEYWTRGRCSRRVVRPSIGQFRRWAAKAEVLHVA